MQPSINFQKLPLKSSIYHPQTGASQDAQRCVIFLHGLGSCGENLIDLSAHWDKGLPNTLFIAPNAPFEYGDPHCEAPWSLHTSPHPVQAHHAFQWFPHTQDYENLLQTYAKKALGHLSTYIDALSDLTQIDPSHMALVGFSQGGMMAIQYALYGNHSLAGVISYSGAQISPQRAPLRATPICLIHGDADEVLPSSYFHHAEAYMNIHKVPYESLLIPKLDHSIDLQGLDKGLGFLKTVFSL